MSEAVAFQYENLSLYAILEEGKCLTIGSGQYDHLRIASLGSSQFTLEMFDGKIYLSGKAPYAFDRYLLPATGTFPIDQAHLMFLYLSPASGVSPLSFTLPFQGEISIGRLATSDLCFALPFISRKHLSLSIQEGAVTLTNHSKNNGTYVNGKRAWKTQLKAGDVISILTCRLLYDGQQLHFENVGESLTIHAKQSKPVMVQEAPTGRVFHRSPRLKSQLPSQEVVLASPPNKNLQNPQKRSLFLQMLGTGTMFTTSMLMGMASPAYMAARSLSLIMPIANMITQRKQDKKMQAQLEQYEALRKELYGKYIEDQKSRIQFYADKQREIITHENPSSTQCLAMPEALDRQLWERTARDADFLDVRLGMGYEKLCVEVKAGRQEANFQMDYDEMKQLASEIIEETAYVDRVPVRLPLTKYQTVGVIGQREKVLSEVRNMIIALTTTHFYKDVKLVGIFDEQESDFWAPMRWLPHVFDDARQSRYMAFNYLDANRLCDRLLEQVIAERKRLLEQRQSYHQRALLPHYILVIGSKRYLSHHPIMEHLLNHQPELGITAIFLFDDLYDLPLETQFIIDVDGEQGFGVGYEPSKTDERFLFSFDDFVGQSAFDHFSRQMASIEVAGYAKQADIPSRITFLEGYQAKCVEDLHIDQRWKKPRQDESMPAAIGMMANQRIFYLDTYEKMHGPHGLIAGATGEGKSELLKTWILSMVINYSSEDVNFVFIDYKGGGMASHFRGAPHVVGEITNLTTGMDRAFEALRSENRRRMALFQQYQVPDNDISHYHEWYRAGKVTEVVPHLFVVVDEFKMLKQQNPEATRQMVEIATIGRALGVHLVLATQSPGEAIDESIQKNAQYRLCLRLQFASESRELIGTIDATSLRNKGRCYVNVKRTGTYEVFQSFYSGAPYDPKGAKQNEHTSKVSEVLMDGTRVALQSSSNLDQTHVPSECEAIVQELIRVAKQMQMPERPRLWLDELPDQIALQDLMPSDYEKGKWDAHLPWLQVPIGLYDSPSTQSQGVLSIDFQRDGNLAIYGSVASGKTNLIKTMMMSIGVHYDPKDVQIYGIDCGGGSTTIFNSLPHVGGIARDGETEKIEALLKMLNDEIERRRQHFLEVAEGIVSLQEYREVVKPDIPVWIFFVDNIVSFLQSYERLYDALYSIVFKGASYGVYFVMSANTTTGYRSQINYHVPNRITLEMNDRADYAVIGKFQGVPLPDRPGRALCKGPLAMQIALFERGDNEAQRTQNLRVFLKQMNAEYDGPRAKRVPVLPETVRMSDLLDFYTQVTRLPIGYRYEDISPAYIDFKRSHTFLVTGIPRSGKSRLLENIMTMIHQRFAHCQLYVFDSVSQSLQECAAFVDHYVVCSHQEKVQEAFIELAGELNARKKDPELLSEKPEIFIFIDHLHDFYTYLPASVSKIMTNVTMRSAGLKVYFVIAGNVDEVQAYVRARTPSEVSFLTNQQAGIILSGTISAYRFYTTDRVPFEKRMQPLESKEAYQVEGTSLIRIRPAK